MTIKLELTEQDIQILSAALGEIPFKIISIDSKPCV